MAGSTARSMPEREPAVRYRLGANSRITQTSRSGGAEQAFVKNVETGRVYRFGAEELFLLRRLGGGGSTETIVSAFMGSFGKVVRRETVEAFAADMLKAGILTLRDERAAPETEGAADARLPVPVAEAAEDEETEANEEDGPGAGDMGGNGPFETLEDMIFAEEGRGAGGARRARPGGGTASSSAPGDGPPTGADDRAASEDGEAEPDPIADPAIARRKLRLNPKTGTIPKPPGMLRLFDPTGLLRILGAIFGWVGGFKWFLWPLTLFASLALLHRLTEAGLNLRSAREVMNVVAVLTLSLFTVNLISRLVTGVVAQRRGAEVRHFGLVAFLAVVPRFQIDTSRVMKLSREDKLAVYASTMQARLAVFIAGTLIWALTRQSATFMSEMALVTANIALFTLLLTALPLLPSDGYRWISTYFNQPQLRERAMAYVFGSAKAAAKYPPPTRGEKWAFILYAIGSALVMALIGVMFVVYLSTALEGRFRGSGIVMFLAIVGLLLVWAILMRASAATYRKQVMTEIVAEAAEERAAGKAGLPARVEQPGRSLVRRRSTQPGRPRPKPMPLPGVYALNAKKARRSRLIARGFWATVAVVLAVVAFLPYDYEVGGEFEILPDRRVEVIARVEGELVEIMVDEGDVVEKGQLLGRVLDRQARRNVDVTAAELAKAQAALRRKREGATPEEIQVAREHVALAESVLPFHKAQAERAQSLLQARTIAASEAERRQSEYLKALQELQTARANLAEVEAAAPESEILMLEAEVKRLEAELAYHEAQLTDTELRAPTPGRVVTENVTLGLGTFLDVGDVFVEIEDHSVANAHVKVSETDIGLVEVGDLVRLKAWGRSEAERIGRVVSIAPVAEEEEYGRVVRVKTMITNEDGFFRPEMTGFAKIEGAEMPVWEAYTRLFDRFFRIEVWSWIP